MKKTINIAIVVALIAAVGLVIAMKQQESKNDAPTEVTVANEGVSSELSGEQSTAAVPRLVDLGASKCIPCKMMKPILDELRQEYEGRFDVIFIDVWENPEESKKYNVKMIPTQIFYDAAGNELFRHEGFYSKEDILGKWEELNIDVEGASDGSGVE
jgi:thioredoxin 1